MTTTITVQRLVAPRGVPAASSLRTWAQAALGRMRGAMTIRIVGEAESRRLNREFRGKDKPTNVLSFPYPELRRAGILGDLVLCAPVVAREAREQGKLPRHHWAHMVVHGTLHLLGHDHMQATEAERMETRERAILHRFGIADPYLVRDEQER